MIRFNTTKHATPEPRAWKRLTVLSVLLGAFLGWLLLHPLTMVIYASEARAGGIGPWDLQRLLAWSRHAFTLPMTTMGGIFAVIGAGVGFVFATFHRLLVARERALEVFKNVSVSELPSLIAAGESEFVEFKQSVRWDAKRQCVLRDLEKTVVRTLAGFLNHRGGSLVLGVADHGAIVGLEDDYATLKQPNRDGFEQFVIGLVKNRLGGHLCPLVHLAFGRLEEKDVCRVVVEPAGRPVYVDVGKESVLYVRMGNSTQALDVQEAIEYSVERWRLGP